MSDPHPLLAGMSPAQIIAEAFAANQGVRPDVFAHQLERVFRSAGLGIVSLAKLEHLASQKLPNELSSQLYAAADFEGGYHEMVVEVRALYAAATARQGQLEGG